MHKSQGCDFVRNTSKIMKKLKESNGIITTKTVNDI